MYLLVCLFLSGLVPNKLSIGRIIRYIKVEARLLFQNGRPIILLSVFHMIMEILMYKRLINILDKHNILNINQFGFRSAHSTTQSTLLITECINK